MSVGKGCHPALEAAPAPTHGHPTRGRWLVRLGIAAALCVLAVVGVLSIGLFAAPSGLLLLAAFFLLALGPERPPAPTGTAS